MKETLRQLLFATLDELMAAENFVAALEGRRPSNLVNRELWTSA